MLQLNANVSLRRSRNIILQLNVEETINYFGLKKNDLINEGFLNIKRGREFIIKLELSCANSERLIRFFENWSGACRMCWRLIDWFERRKEDKPIFLIGRSTLLPIWRWSICILIGIEWEDVIEVTRYVIGYIRVQDPIGEDMWTSRRWTRHDLYVPAIQVVIDLGDAMTENQVLCLNRRFR